MQVRNIVPFLLGGQSCPKMHLVQVNEPEKGRSVGVDANENVRGMKIRVFDAGPVQPRARAPISAANLRRRSLCRRAVSRTCLMPGRGAISTATNWSRGRA